MNSDIILVKIEIELPKGSLISKISLDYSHYLIKLISVVKNSHLIQIEGINVEHLDFKSKYAKVTIFHKEEGYILINIQTAHSTVLNTIMSSSLHLKYPLIIRNGKLVLETIARRDIIDNILDEFSGYNAKTKIKSIGRYNPKFNLTLKQYELLNLAFEQGYFDIPRRVDMNDLSSQLNVSKSALSEMFRRAIKNILLKVFG